MHQATSIAASHLRRQAVHAAVLAGTVVFGLVGAGAALQEAQQLELHMAPAPFTLFWPGAVRPAPVAVDVSAPTITDDSANAANASGTVDSAVPDTGPPPIVTRTYTVHQGDTVQSIAYQFGVSNETIIWENDMLDPDHLSIGQQLEILPFTGLVHQVRPGDTVASIANFYGANITDVVRVNQLHDPWIIVVGQTLAVPGGYRPLPAEAAAAAAAAAAASNGDTESANPDDQQAASAPAPRRFPLLGNTPQEQFIAGIAPAAVDSQDATGVPASVTIAQAIIESYWGSSRLSAEDNNYFGIKGDSKPGTAGVVWFDTWEVLSGRSVMVNAPFRAYNSMADSFVDHGNFFLENPRYASALAVKDDARQFAQAIAHDGYATAPDYASKLIQLMDRYDLYRYDDL
jgi:flagellum-specific peptidoglycan hydrolase FlgJ